MPPQTPIDLSAVNWLAPNRPRITSQKLYKVATGKIHDQVWNDLYTEYRNLTPEGFTQRYISDIQRLQRVYCLEPTARPQAILNALTQYLSRKYTNEFTEEYKAQSPRAHLPPPTLKETKQYAQSNTYYNLRQGDTLRLPLYVMTFKNGHTSIPVMVVKSICNICNNYTPVISTVPTSRAAAYFQGGFLPTNDRTAECFHCNPPISISQLNHGAVTIDNIVEKHFRTQIRKPA